MRSSSRAARSGAGSEIGRRVARSTNTCTNQPSAAMHPRCEKTYSVTHARSADMLHAQACLDRLRKCQRAQKAAVGFGAYADDRASEKIQPSLFDQISADDGVEVAIVLNVVDMTVYIIVVPSGRDQLEILVVSRGSGIWKTPFRRIRLLFFASILSHVHGLPLGGSPRRRKGRNSILWMHISLQLRVVAKGKDCAVRWGRFQALEPSGSGAHWPWQRGSRAPAL